MLKNASLVFMFSLFMSFNSLSNPDEEFANDIRTGEIYKKPNWSRDYTERYVHYLYAQERLNVEQIDLAIYKCSDLFFHYIDKVFMDDQVDEYGYALYLWGRSYLLKRNFSEALNFLSKGIDVGASGLFKAQKYPYLSSCYYYRALTYQAQGQKDLAIQDLMEACRTYNNNLLDEEYNRVSLEVIYFQTALLYLGIGNIPEAYKNFIESLFSCGKFSTYLKSIHYYAGSCALLMSHFQEAEHHLTESLLLQPSNVQMDTEIYAKLIAVQKEMGKLKEIELIPAQSEITSSEANQKKPKTLKRIKKEKSTSNNFFSNINLKGIFDNLSE